MVGQGEAGDPTCHLYCWPIPLKACSTKNVFLGTRRHFQNSYFVEHYKLSSFVGVFKTFGKSLEKMFFKIGAFISVANFTGKQLCRNLFSRPADLLKRYSKKAFSCEIYEIFKNIFLKHNSDYCLWRKHKNFSVLLWFFLYINVGVT